MRLTPQQRRSRIYEIAHKNAEYRRIEAECDAAEKRFTAFVNKLPKGLRNLLWSYPGMFYFRHHNLLNIICEQMVFPDEEPQECAKNTPEV